MKRQPKLTIPYIEGLNGNPAPDVIVNLLDANCKRQVIDCVNWKKDFPYQPLTTFTAGHSKDYLYIDFFTRCNFLRAENYLDNSPVSQDSCVEFFIEPYPESPEYWNFEFNCIGTVNASHRIERSQPTRLTASEISMIKRYPSCGTRPFKELQGLFSWNLIVGVPLEMMGLRYEGKPIETLANFYKCASKATMPHYLSWSPIETENPDFHRPEFFAPVTLL